VKVIVDTNIVFSALLNSGSRIGEILLYAKEPLQFYTCNYLQTELQKHRDKLLKLTKLSEAKLAEIEKLITHRITFIDEHLLPQSILIETEALLKSIDQNDTPFVALAVHLNGKLWTGDMKLYHGLKEKRFEDIMTTAELSLLLEDLER